MKESVRNLLKAALVKTESHELKWVRFNDDSFHVRIGPGFILLRRTKLDFDTYDYFIEITDSQVRAFEQDFVSVDSEDNPLVGSLFCAAAISSIFGENVIDDMLAALECPKNSVSV